MFDIALLEEFESFDKLTIRQVQAMGERRLLCCVVRVHQIAVGLGVIDDSRSAARIRDEVWRMPRSNKIRYMAEVLERIGEEHEQVHDPGIEPEVKAPVYRPGSTFLAPSW